jgi:hypothetical protein
MLNTLQAATIEQYSFGQGAEIEARRIASKLFERALTRGRLWRLVGQLTGRDTSLNVLESPSLDASRRTSKPRLVSIRDIAGSESRSQDFDARFNPLKSHHQERWISIACARRMGTPLPPIRLIQVGSAYYIRDGHHRVSVARAMGQMEIEAVIVN